MNSDTFQNWLLTFKRANRAQRAILIAGASPLLLPFLFNIPGVGDWLKGKASANKVLSIILGVGTLLCYIYYVWKLWRAPIATGPQPKLDRPALKGASKFTERDGELFMRLGRRRQVEQLLAWIEDAQISLIAVQGESGAGKSSLLDGGLRFLLSHSGKEFLGRQMQEPTGCVFCEMRSSNPIGALLKAINRALSECVLQAPLPPLDRLEEAGAHLRRTGKRWVIILDQFEQLSLDQCEHRPLFDFLRAAASQGDGNLLTCVVAFRNEYASKWNRFAARLESVTISPVVKLLPLELFQTSGREGEQAKDVLATLGNAANMELTEVAEPLISLIQDREGHVSPFDLSLSLKCLDEMGDPVPKLHSLPSGGFPALIAAYLRKRLKHESPSRREAVFATIHLKLTRNTPEGRQRLAEGLPLTDLAKEGSLTEPDLKAALDHLADPDSGLLEIVNDGSGNLRYRLLHERFIAPLELVAGSALADVQQARRIFHDCWGAYEKARPWERLLRGNDLEVVRRNWDKMQDLREHESKRAFYERSLRHWHASRSIRGSLALMVLLLILGAGHFSQRQSEIREALTIINTIDPGDNGFLDIGNSAKFGHLAKCNRHARVAALVEVLAKPELAKRFVNGENYLTHSVVGLDPSGTTSALVSRELRRFLEGSETNILQVECCLRIAKFVQLSPVDRLPVARALVRRLTNSTLNLNSKEFPAWSQALAPLSTNLKPAERAATAMFLVSRMTNESGYLRTHDAGPLGLVLAALATNLGPTERGLLATATVSRLTNASKLDGDHLAALGQALVSLSINMTPTERFDTAMSVMCRITNMSGDMSYPRIEAVRLALAPLSTSLGPTDRGHLATALVSRITNGTPNLPSYDLAALGLALVPLSTDFGAMERGPLVMALVNQMTNRTAEYRDHFASLGPALVRLSINMNTAERAAAAMALVSRMTNEVTFWREGDAVAALSLTLASLGTNLGPAECGPLATALVRRMTDATDYLDNEVCLSLGQALSSFSINLSLADRAAFAKALASRMTNAAYYESRRVAALGLALPPLVTNLDQTVCGPLATALVSRMTNTSSSLDHRIVGAMGLALAPLSKNLGPTERDALILALVSRMTDAGASPDDDDFKALGQAFASLSAGFSQTERVTGAMAFVSGITNSAAILRYSSGVDLRRSLARLCKDLSPAESAPLVTAIVGRMTNGSAGLGKHGLAVLGHALSALGTKVSGSQALAAIQSLETAMLRGDDEGNRDMLTEAWIALEPLAYGYGDHARRIDRLVRWMDLPHFAVSAKAFSNLYGDAHAMLLRHLGTFAQEEFRDSLCQFTQWATDSNKGGRLGIRLPDRPNWLVFKPETIPHPSHASSLTAQ